MFPASRADCSSFCSACRCRFSPNLEQIYTEFSVRVFRRQRLLVDFAAELSLKSPLGHMVGKQGGGVEPDLPPPCTSFTPEQVSLLSIATVPTTKSLQSHRTTYSTDKAVIRRGLSAFVFLLLMYRQTTRLFFSVGTQMSNYRCWLCSLFQSGSPQQFHVSAHVNRSSRFRTCTKLRVSSRNYPENIRVSCSWLSLLSLQPLSKNSGECQCAHVRWQQDITDRGACGRLRRRCQFGKTMMCCKPKQPSVYVMYHLLRALFRRHSSLEWFGDFLVANASDPDKLLLRSSYVRGKVQITSRQYVFTHYLEFITSVFLLIWLFDSRGVEENVKSTGEGFFYLMNCVLLTHTQRKMRILWCFHWSNWLKSA